MNKKNDIYRSIEAVRFSLLDLHKTIVDHSRIDYEQNHGPIQSPGEWLGLLMSDPFFRWLGPLTTLITSIDELLEADVPPTTSDANTLRAQIEHLILDELQGETEFKPNYLDMLQRHTVVVLAHAKVKEKLASLEILKN